jgi:hypothetical protein
MLYSVLVGTVLILLQLLAALPWLSVADPRGMRQAVRQPLNWALALGAVVVGGVGLGVFITVVQEATRLLLWGRVFGAVLHLQLMIDVFVLFFPLLLWVWPQGGAVALAAFREGFRQPLFWVIILIVLVLMTASPLFPYFTFGEDYKVIRELGYDLIMLSAVVFSVFEASIRISEEIEGRTAITVMSKPVSRRQFLIGKFLGILLAALLMTGLLAWSFNWILWMATYFTGDTVTDPLWLELARRDYAWLGDAPLNFALGAGLWMDNVTYAAPGLIFGFCQAMVLLAVAVALATRLPMIVNLVILLFVFFLGHLTHVLVQASYGRFALVNFLARFFDVVLPGLDYFDYGQLVVRDLPPDPGSFAIYIGSVSLYAVLYSVIALLLGLILFEDRDLA